MNDGQDEPFLVNTWCSLSTRELLEIGQTQNGSGEASQDVFNTLYDRYCKEIYHFALSKVHSHDDACDICAKVWLLVVQKNVLQEFIWDDQARTGDPFKSWLIATAMHKVQEFLREGSHEIALSEALDFVEQKLSHLDDYSTFLEPDALSQKRRAADRILKKVLKEVNHSLSPTEHKIVLLSYFSNKNATEIGQLLNMKPATVRQQHGRSLKRLRRCLKDYHEKFDAE